MDENIENAKIGCNDSQISNCSPIFSQETHRYLLKDLYDFTSTLLSQGDNNGVATQYQVHGSEFDSDMQYSATLPRSQGFLRHEELNIQTDSFIIRPECSNENYARQEFIPSTQDSSIFNAQENSPFYNFQNAASLTHVKPNNQSLYSSLHLSQNSSNEIYPLNDFNLNDPINNLCNLNSPTSVEFPQLIKQETTPRASVINSNPKTLRDLPSNVPFPGQYGFQFFINEINEKNVNKKAISYTFSAEKNKLYIRMNETCPINFKVKKTPPAQSYIRSMAIYGRPQDLGEAVKRCMTHVDKDKDLPEPPRSHFIRCSNAGVVYAENPETERQSVTIPYQTPEKGTNFSTYYFQFSCYSSCSGSINRRPVQLIFTLECGNQVLGRQVLDLRVCSCPGRDKEVDDVPKRRPEKIERVTTLTSVADPAPKRRMVDRFPSTNGFGAADNDSEIFTVQIRGRELYKIVQTIVQNFEIARNVAELAALRSSNNKAAESRENGRTTTTPPSSLSPVRISDADENKQTEMLKHQNCETIFKRQNSQQQQSLEQLIGRLSQEKKFSGSSPISSWLETMCLKKYLPNFEADGLHQMDQLKDFSHEKLRSLGIEDGKDLDQIYESIIRFKLACVGYGSSQQAIGSGGLHISRTTVKHSYKFDTGED